MTTQDRPRSPVRSSDTDLLRLLTGAVEKLRTIPDKIVDYDNRLAEIITALNNIDASLQTCLGNVSAALAQTVTQGGTTMYLSAPATGLGVITGVWESIDDVFDTVEIGEVDAVANLTDGTITFSEPGIWQIHNAAKFDVVASNANETREIEVAFRNTSDDNRYIFGSAQIARYGETVSFTGIARVAIEAAQVGIPFDVQIRATGSSVDITQVDSAEFSVTRVSNEGLVTT